METNINNKHKSVLSFKTELTEFVKYYVTTNRDCFPSDKTETISNILTI